MDERGDLRRFELRWVGTLAAELARAGRPDAEGEARRFLARVPVGYVERTTPAAAAGDIEHLAELRAAGDGQERMAVADDPDPAPGMFRLRLYRHRAVELSSFLPVLETFGLIVVEAVPHRIAGERPGDPPSYLDDFGVRAPGGWAFDPDRDGPRLLDAIAALRAGDVEADSLNRLVVRARIGWDDVVVLRAYRRFLRHAGSPWSDRQLDDPLVAAPDVTVALLGYFAARFGPDHAGGGDPDAADEARRRVLEALNGVDRLELDQVLRGYLQLVDATLRTSHWVRDDQGRPRSTLALKLASDRIDGLPSPRPHVETFVHARRVEGMHLRAGPIARGGIRWSDRQDDLRSEILGLLRAQVLKNAIIVPTGAKGGFVCRCLPAEATRSEVQAEVEACYRAFIGALLDVTDNLVAGRVVGPAGVRRADGDDPYLVVAADKGTAALSDVANEISTSRSFWLGDAFASGGSRGYDHKAMGITARGAWVVARQHFRQLGMDIQTEPFRVCGVGDMSGDVFGNGMLRSGAIKLVAAFDHRDVFIDPDPDPAASLVERRRLFETPGSSWQDYPVAALSAGGGVWSRTAKLVPLSAEASAALGLGAGSLSPPEVISAILAAPCDLLWFGGIGTYVKASTESDADAADRADDALRVDADRVRARVVVEGGNLGVTPRARVQYSRRGGLINADFIDNAAGVATSDREVNLKILLALALDAGAITPEERDAMLGAVTDEVADAVLRAVGLSAAAVTREVTTSAADLDAYEALIVALEAQGRLDRTAEALPDDDELARRRQGGAGLTRPEIAVLLALSKSALAGALVGSALVGDAEVAEAVRSYFPRGWRSRFADLIEQHRLRDELAATAIGSEIVDRMGVIWAAELAAERGVGLAAVATAYWAARQVLDAEARWRELEEVAPSVSADEEADLHRRIAGAVDTLARCYLDRRPPPGPSEAVAQDRALASALAGGDGGDGDGLEGRVAALHRAATAGVVGGAAPSGSGVAAAAAFVAGTDRALGIDALLALLRPGERAGRWERWERRRLADDVRRLQGRAVDDLLRAAGPGGAGPDGAGPEGAGPDGAGPAAVLAGWVADRREATDRLGQLRVTLAAAAPQAPPGSAASAAAPAADLALAALVVRALADVVDALPG